MVILYMAPPTLTPSYKHIYSDWQIAEDIKFKKIVKESLEDDKNLTTKIFNVDLDPKKKYYARARLALEYKKSDGTTGRFISEWSDVSVLNIKEIDDLNIRTTIPSFVSIPDISTDLEDLDNATNGFFKILTGSFNTNSNATHTGTTYIILDTDNNVAYLKENDTSNLYGLLVPPEILEEGKEYIIMAAHHSSSNDVSDFAKEIIRVPRLKEIVINSRNAHYYEDDYELELEPVEGVDEIKVELYAYDYRNNEKEFIKTYKDNKFKFKISSDIFKNYIANRFVFKIGYKFNNGLYLGDKVFMLYVDRKKES